MGLRLMRLGALYAGEILREVSPVALARTGAGSASARIEVAEEGGKPQRLAARLREVSAGSKVQSLGRRKQEVAARVIVGKSVWTESATVHCVRTRSEMTEVRSQSIGRPKIVLTVMSELRAKESVVAEPEVST